LILRSDLRQTLHGLEAAEGYTTPQFGLLELWEPTPADACQHCRDALCSPLLSGE